MIKSIRIFVGTLKNIHKQRRYYPYIRTVYEDEHLHTNLSRLCILFNLNIYFIMYLFEKIIKNYDIYNININDEKSIK